MQELCPYDVFVAVIRKWLMSQRLHMILFIILLVPAYP